MDFVDVDYTEVPDEPVTDTWYTCPACGCLNHSGPPAIAVMIRAALCPRRNAAGAGPLPQ